MKKILLMFAALMATSELQARYAGVDPCAGPDKRVTIINSTTGVLVSTESFAGGGGGLLCDLVISSGSLNVVGGGLQGDYVVCIDSAPRSYSTNLPTVITDLGSEIDVSTDTRLIAPAVIAISSVPTALPANFSPVPFTNLMCDLSNTRTKAFAYWVPSVQ